MNTLVHIVLFLVSGAIIWFFAGLLIESVDRVARRFHQSGFTVAFFVLGLLTSISEISVMVNSVLDDTPEVSAGNLVGATLVIILCIVPLLAVAGKGIRLLRTLRPSNLALALLVALLPVLLMVDGSVTRSEGLACVLLYIALLYLIRKHPAQSAPKVLRDVEADLVDSGPSTALDAVKIIVGALCIFGAGHMLVSETVYIAGVLSVPSSIIGLVILSVGTNIPELVIAIRAVRKKRSDIAFGDYIGSVVANTLVFGLLPILHGSFVVEPWEFRLTALLMVVGFIGFYIATRSKHMLSRGEGKWLFVVYVVFCLVQVINFIRFAAD